MWTSFFNAADGTVAQDYVDGLADFLAVVDNYQASVVAWSTDEAVVEVDLPTGEAVDAFPVTPATGSGASGTVLPPQVMALMTCNTGAYVGGRLVVGRTNLPWFNEDQSSGGVLIGTTITAIEAAHNTFRGSSTYTPVVYSRKGLAAYPITSVSVGKRFSTIRSRAV